MSRDDEGRQMMETTRNNLERLQDLRVSEPVYHHKEWRVPEREEEPPQRHKLDTDPNAALTARINYLEGKLAETLPAIATFMENVDKTWREQKQRAETAERRLAETEKRLSDMQRSGALDIRGVELAWQSDLLSLRQERHKEPAHDAQ
jgi:hypothetical protein